MSRESIMVDLQSNLPSASGGSSSTNSIRGKRRIRNKVCLQYTRAEFRELGTSLY